MSIAVRKVRFTTTETSNPLSRSLLAKGMAVYMGALPGCSVSHPLVEEGYKYYININISGNRKDQFTVTTQGYNSIATYFGLCENGYEPDLTSSSYIFPPKAYYANWPMHEDVLSYHDFYFFIQDNSKLICFSDPIAGYMVFKHDEDGLRTYCQRTVQIPDWYNNGNGLTQIMSPIYDSVFSDFLMLNDNEDGECVYLGGCKNLASVSNTNHALPSNKLIKYSKILCDKFHAVEQEVTDYPENMAGNLLLNGYSGNVVIGQGDLSASYKKVTVNGQNYMHIGGASWLPYDSISETTIPV